MRKFIGIILFFVFLGCAGGHLRTGVYPNHNEDIINVVDAVAKYRIEVSQRFRYKALELEANPIFIGGGAWGDKGQGQNNSYNPEFWLLDNHIIGRIWFRENINLFIDANRYFMLTNPENRNCNCTYGNLIGVEMNWQK